MIDNESNKYIICLTFDIGIINGLVSFSHRKFVISVTKHLLLNI